MLEVPPIWIYNYSMLDKLKIGVKNRLGYDYVADLGCDMIDDENYTPDQLKKVCEDVGGMDECEIADVYETWVDRVKFK
jgi:hypothetical protein